MKARGARCTVTEFHAAVNVAFHNYEAEIYDEGHRDMWESLPAQFNILTEDCVRACPDLPERFRVLDIGCGTGLASDCLLRSPLGGRICEIDLLDTSSAMLEFARRRATSWEVPVSCHETTLDNLAGLKQYELIVGCSVLHHVPDLAAFLRCVRSRQTEGGLFLHLQDPNGDHLNDEQLRRRVAEVSERRLPEWVSRLAPRRVIGRLYRELTGQQRNDYLSKTNRELLRKGIIRKPLTVAEVFTITDIHVQGGRGISIAQMRGWLPDYHLVSQRAYAFFGKLRSALPAARRVEEDDLVRRRASDGAHIGAVWRLIRK